MLLTLELAKRTSVKVNALHPGVLATNAFRDYPGFIVKFVNLFLEKPQRGGERIAYLSTSDKVAGITGKYFYKMEEKEFDIPAREREKAEKLWQMSEELTEAFYSRESPVANHGE